MNKRRLLTGMIGVAAFVLNPALACGPSDPVDNFDYGETEMVAAVQGSWQLTFSRPEGTSSVTFTVEPGPRPSALPSGAPVSGPGRAPQCGTRTFTRPAAACLTTSELLLAATVAEADPALATTDGKGWYTVFGEHYGGGNLDLSFGSDLHLSADLDASNAVTQSYVDWQGARVTSVLTRVAPSP